MSLPPGDPGASGSGGGAGGSGGAAGSAGAAVDFAVVLHDERREIWAARARLVGRELARGGAVAGRAAGRGGRTGLIRLRAYLRTPEGRATAGRTVRAVGVAAAVVGGIVLARGWLDSLARGAGVFGAGLRVVAGGFRAAAGAVGAAARAARLGLPLRWLGSLARWLVAAGGRSRRRVRCPDCHAAVRADAHVCYRCGYRPAARAGDTVGAAARRRGAVSGAARFVSRVVLLRLVRPCPDCRRRVHADARVCGHCGYRLRG